MRGRWAAILLLVVAALVALAACGGGEDEAATGALHEDAEGPGGAEGADAVRGEAADSALVARADVPRVEARIVKTASISLEVDNEEFEEAFERASLVAGEHGGFVSSSSSEGTERRSGSLVLRVPATAFEGALAALRRLGEVESEEISGEDVTSEFVDLEARLRNWEAQERVLLRLMDRASTIEDSITVQRNLQEVQLAIEQIRGQLRVLRDRTELSTITVSVRESGAPAPSGEQPSFARAWQLAVRGFVSVVTGLVVALGYVLPLAAIALAAFAVYRRVRPRAVSA